MTQSAPERVLVMTGATSGIGAQAIARIAAQTSIRALVGARSTPTATPAGTDVIPLDLASLDNVREFAETVIQRIPASGSRRTVSTCWSSTPEHSSPRPSGRARTASR